jgi:hypothetical protein
VKTQPLRQSDAAYLLRRSLGPSHVWEDLLSDMRQGKSNYYGLVLLPAGRTAGKCPLYAIFDVQAFIEEAKRACPPPANAATAIKVLSFVEVDPARNKALWRSNILKASKFIPSASRTLSRSRYRASSIGNESPFSYT